VNGGPYTVVYDREPRLIQCSMRLDSDPRYAQQVAVVVSMPQVQNPIPCPVPDGSGDVAWSWQWGCTADFCLEAVWGNGSVAHWLECDVREGQVLSLPTATVEVALYTRCYDVIGAEVPELCILGAHAAYGVKTHLSLTQELELWWVVVPGVPLDSGITDGLVLDSNILPGCSLDLVGQAVVEAFAQWG
jgi:hypothetical protein